MEIYYTKYKENHSAPDNNLQEINIADLPHIKNLINIEMKTEYNRNKRQLKGSNNINI